MSERLRAGLTRFRREIFPGLEARYRRLAAEGQKPHTLFIGCSDSRVVSSRLVDALPGELFVVRNIGNLVPPYEKPEGYHGVSAAIEYAVGVLEVSDIVICGHSHCGAMRALYDPPDRLPPHVARWLDSARAARLEGAITDGLLEETERRSIALQLEHLRSFPLVRERLERGLLAIHGWHYVIETGEVFRLDEATGSFNRIEV
jgi:carbonic anhydrase